MWHLNKRKAISVETENGLVVAGGGGGGNGGDAGQGTDFQL